MAGNPNYWSMNGMHPQSHSQFVYGSNNNNNNINININDNNNSSSVITSESTTATADHQDFPVRSWSQLLLGGLASGEEERYGASLFQQQKKLENWEDHHQILNLNNSISNYGRINNNNNNNNHGVDVKQEVAQTSSCQLYESSNNNNNNGDDDQFHDDQANRSWPHHMVMPVSSPTSCVTSLSNNNFLNFSGVGGKAAAATPGKINHHHNQEHSSEGSQSRGVNDLRSRGLCLVPISCTENVGNDNGADYWAPAALGGGF
ncbi:transcription factor bhlh68 [Phtheirospermum japonicum]|uniref:Transcription factor bhlh68 n=1 Tax=Phtheirospermum japonicum TaxID=374723 RepID=A0A830DHP3_9LAMI|nr:transcription factor bhlh68 [Phtheirospermum japonicum]